MSGAQCQQGRHEIRVKKTDFPRGKSEAAGRMCSAVVQRGEGFRVALTGRCMSGRSHQGRGFGSARALPGAHRRRWPPHAPCGRDCAIMRRLIGSFHRNKTNFYRGDRPISFSHSARSKMLETCDILRCFSSQFDQNFRLLPEFSILILDRSFLCIAFPPA